MSTLKHRRIVSAALALIAVACIVRPARALDPRAPLNHFALQSWRTENGLPQNSVHAILQTPDGFLWLATEAGLARFDGYNFTTYDTNSSPALPNSDIRCLLQSRDGSLWIGTANGLVRWRDGRLTTFTTANGLPANTIQSLNEGNDGTLWALTAEGLAAGSNGTFRAFGQADGLPSDRVSAIVQTADATLWVNTSAGLARVRNAQVERLAGLPAGAITAMAAGENGSLLLATSGGVVRYANHASTAIATKRQIPQPVQLLFEDASGVWAATKDGVTLIHVGEFTTFNAANGLPGGRIETMIADREGATWIGANAGLARYFDGHLSALGTGSASRGSVISIFEDREGDLWTGTDSGGLDILRDQRFSTWTTSQGLSSDATTAVLQSADGSVWAGTNGGGLNRIGLLNGGKVAAFTTANGMISDIVLALASDPAGNVWAGTPDGLMRFNSGSLTTFTSADGLADDLVRSLLADRDGSLWIGSRRGLTHWRDGVFTTFTRQQGLGSDLVGAMLQDRGGDLWVATLGGLTRIRNGRAQNFTTRDGLSSNVITALHQDTRGTLWIGTNGAGLCRWNGKTFYRFVLPSSFPRLIFSILEDAKGNLWLSSDHGIYRVSLNDLEQFEQDSSHPINVTAYGAAEGLPTGEAGNGHPAAWRTTDGRLWFATQHGLAVIDPQNTRENRSPPPVVIERITVDDQVVSPGEIANIAPGHSRIAFEYAGLSFIAPQMVRYRYKLDGFDRDWTDAGARRIAYYTNIPPGRYRFLVQAANNDGVWSAQPAPVAFRLRPRFFQTVWFALGLVALLALIIFLLYRLRVRRIRQRFDAVMMERNRLAREIHDTLAQDFVAVSVQLELMSQLLAVSALDPAREQLDRTRDLVRDGLADARRSIWDLRSEGRESETLPARLRRTVAAATQQNNITPHIEITGTYTPLAAATENELLRVAQEALANVVRHSRAANVNVRLLYDPKRVALEITDDGCGFDPAIVRSSGQGHFGLTGMRERAQQIRGQATIDSTPGNGTRVRIEAPTSPAEN